jgi:hypothetical protein
MVSPRSTESSTAEKFLDASDAVTSRIRSEYHNLNFRFVREWLFGSSPASSCHPRFHACTDSGPHAHRRQRVVQARPTHPGPPAAVKQQGASQCPATLPPFGTR